jgi:hypothetical protein
MVESVFSPVERDTAQVPSHEIDELLLLSSWFRRFPAELARSRAASAYVAEPPSLDGTLHDAASSSAA